MVKQKAVSKETAFCFTKTGQAVAVLSAHIEHRFKSGC
jgi:hypothetical protein